MAFFFRGLLLSGRTTKKRVCLLEEGITGGYLPEYIVMEALPSAVGLVFDASYGAAFVFSRCPGNQTMPLRDSTIGSI